MGLVAPSASVSCLEIAGIALTVLELEAKSDVYVEEGGYSDEHMENFEVGYSLLSDDERAATTSMTVSLMGLSDSRSLTVSTEGSFPRVEGEVTPPQEDESCSAFSGSLAYPLGGFPLSPAARLSQAHAANELDGAIRTKTQRVNNRMPPMMKPSTTRCFGGATVAFASFRASAFDTLRDL